LVGDEDRVARDPLEQVEPHELLGLLDLEALRHDPELQRRARREALERPRRLRERDEARVLHVVVRADRRGDDDRGVAGRQRRLGQPPQQPVVVVGVVAAELRDHLAEFRERVVRGHAQAVLDHRLDRRAPRRGRELARRVERVVDVEEHRSQLSHGGAQDTARRRRAANARRLVNRKGPRRLRRGPSKSHVDGYLRNDFSCSFRSEIVALTITIRFSISLTEPRRPRKKLANGMDESQGVSAFRSFMLMDFRPPSRIVPPSGTRTVVAAFCTRSSGIWIVTGVVNAPSDVVNVGIGRSSVAIVGFNWIVTYLRSWLTVGCTSSTRPSWMTPTIGSAMNAVWATSTSKSWMNESCVIRVM